jgi:hypothetical protein
MRQLAIEGCTRTGHLVVEQGSGHLRASSVVGADEQDFGGVGYAVPFDRGRMSNAPQPGQAQLWRGSRRTEQT